MKNDKYNFPEDKIGFEKIRKLIAAYCSCALGSDMVEKMRMLTAYDDIARLLTETSEMLMALTDDSMPEAAFYDSRLSLKRIRIEGTFLELRELFELQRSLAAIDAYGTFFRKMENDVYVFPRLAKLAEQIVTFPKVEKRISHIVDEQGEMRDGASSELAAIRREIQASTKRISSLLGRILLKAQEEGLIDKSVSPAVRDGRLVLPVASALKRRIGGIVHDQSDSGRTIYIEPTEVVEANNRIRELENDERREMLKILHDVTNEIRPYADDILRGYEFLAAIDFTRAKAKFARDIEAVRPVVERMPRIDWSMARHPLLELSLRRKGGKIVSLDIELKAPKARILVISGPNAGGKSVCLKTVALLQYMLQCGLLVPMAESSRCGIFKQMYIDIGDEQDIEDDLSTYSSHLLNMKNMLRHSDAHTLLLIDEMGGGTEPQIGGAIAESILRRLNQRQAFGVVTTHYQNLKTLANDTDGMVNGAMLYDRGKMQPLFQLRIGNPGSSFAIEIARKIGIPEDIINDAAEIVGNDYVNSDKYLQDIVRDKRYWETKRQNIHQHEKKMEQTIERYEQDIKRLQSEKRDIIEKAKTEAEQLLNQTNAKIEQTIRDIREAQAEKERTKNIRQDFAEFRQTVNNIDTEATEERIRRQMEKIKARQQRREKKKAEKAVAQPGSVSKPVEIVLTEGMYVKMKGQNVVGQITKINGREAGVIFGNVQTNIKLSILEPASPPKSEKRAATFVSIQTQDHIRKTTLAMRTELDVRGMRADEAMTAVMTFIDNALIANADRVKILHGTGEGILRSVVRQYLATVPAVADFHDEDIRFGGSGITVVDLL